MGLELLPPGNFLINLGGQLAVGLPANFTGTMAQVMPTALAAANVGNGVSGQTASGTTQATAYQITQNYTVFTTVASTSGAVLSPALSGLVKIYNRGANALTLWPPGIGFSGQIEGAGANTSISVATGTTLNLVPFNGGTQWYSG